RPVGVVCLGQRIAAAKSGYDEDGCTCGAAENVAHSSVLLGARSTTNRVAKLYAKMGGKAAKLKESLRLADASLRCIPRESGVVGRFGPAEAGMLAREITTEHAELEALDLAALLCSRVCHDIISPVGAIINGLEVLDENNSPEMKDFAFGLIRRS